MKAKKDDEGKDDMTVLNVARFIMLLILGTCGIFYVMSRTDEAKHQRVQVRDAAVDADGRGR